MSMETYREEIEGRRAGVELSVKSWIACTEFHFNKIGDMGAIGEVAHEVLKQETSQQCQNKAIHCQTEDVSFNGGRKEHI